MYRTMDDKMENRTYTFFPFCQKIAPNKRDETIKYIKRAKLYSGLLQ